MRIALYFVRRCHLPVKLVRIGSIVTIILLFSLGAMMWYVAGVRLLTVVISLIGIATISSILLRRNVVFRQKYSWARLIPSNAPVVHFWTNAVMAPVMAWNFFSPPQPSYIANSREVFGTLAVMCTIWALRAAAKLMLMKAGAETIPALNRLVPAAPARNALDALDDLRTNYWAKKYGKARSQFVYDIQLALVVVYILLAPLRRMLIRRG